MADTDAYLLDTNVISTLMRPSDSHYAFVKKNFDAIPIDAKIALPVMTIAEIEFGMAKTTAPDPIQQQNMRKFFAKHPWHLGFDDGTVKYYAIVRAKLWDLYGTMKGSKKRSHHERLPDQLRDRATAQWIGIDERDLVIVSVALQYNLLFATKDRNDEMKRIETAVEDVWKIGKLPEKLRLLDWTPAKPP